MNNNGYSPDERAKLAAFQDPNGWISFRDLPPKKHTDVLLTNGSSVFIGHYAYENRLYYQDNSRVSYGGSA